MRKFNRNYKLIFEIKEYVDDSLSKLKLRETIEIKYPFTLEFNIEHSVYSETNSGYFRLYNLNSDIQAKLWKDKAQIRKIIDITLYAGYEDYMPLIFKGKAIDCYTFRDGGDTDFTTEIHAFDGMDWLLYGFTSTTFKVGTKMTDIVNMFTKDLNMFDVGYISPDIPPLPCNQTFIGQTLDLLGREYGGYQIFVDKGELNILGKQDVIPGQLLVITSESGLLGTPRRMDSVLEVEMMFEPRITTAQAIKLLVDSLPELNGTYKVVGLSHNGIISPTIAGTLTTRVYLGLFGYAFKELVKPIETNYGGTVTKGKWTKPVEGRMTSVFDEPRTNRLHKGIDIGVPKGTSVKAPANGKVVFSGIQGGYGNLVILDNGTIDGKKITSYYGHLSKILVNDRQEISQGQVIGLSGNTGNSYGKNGGYHLHFGVKENGTFVNPIKYVGNYSR